MISAELICILFLKKLICMVVCFYSCESTMAHCTLLSRGNIFNLTSKRRKVSCLTISLSLGDQDYSTNKTTKKIKKKHHEKSCNGSAVQ
jgi:hypothetical protein